MAMAGPETVPELLMPPEKFDTVIELLPLSSPPPMAMAARFVEEIVPELVMPPPKVDSVVEATEPPMSAPNRLAAMTPELLMPPKTPALFSMRIP